MNIAAIGWAKARSSKGEFRLDGRAGPVPAIDLVSLSAPGLSASGTVSLREGGGLDRARLDQVRVGGWLQAPVDLVGRGPGNTPAIFVRGGSIDLRNAEFGTGGGGSSGGSTPLRVALERLQVTDTIVLNGFEGRFESGSGLGGDFSASVNGRAPITGTIAPRNGRSTIQVSSSNAGATLDAAGVFRNSRGGDLSLVLRPVGENGVFDGTLNVRNTQMRNVPLMAELLSSLSIVGLLEQLSGDGIGFSEVDASFRMTPSVIALTEASAVGPSMGISMDGTYRVADKALDMQGVISPVYFLNSIGSIFTRQGEGLIGFSYRVGGTADNPSVQVNPLSALTPGTFREIFRSPPPTVTSEGEVRRKWPERREREVEER
ncbi:MAG: AsmA-like C-terminal region-containing protein [Pseudomonadota bacterium]